MEGEDRVHSGESPLHAAGSIDRLGGSKKAGARFRDAKTMLMKTLDTQKDSVSNQSVINGDLEATTLERSFKNKVSLSGSQVSSQLRNVAQSVKWLTSLRRTSNADVGKSGAARAFLGLEFMSKNVCNISWPEVETIFGELAINALLPRSQFGKCIGMLGSDVFAGHLFDGLARRRGVMSSLVTKDELDELRRQLTDQSFDAKLQTFCDWWIKMQMAESLEKKLKRLYA